MKSYRLLLLSADSGVRNLLANALQREDRQVRGVSNLAELSKCAREAPCHLLVASHGSDSSGGLRLLRRFRAICPGTPAILTGDEDPGGVAAAMRSRAYAYFHEPVSPLALADMVELALGSESWQDDLRVVSANPCWIGFSLRAKVEAADRAVQFARAMFSNLPGRVCEDVSAAFRELLFNAVEHGGKLDPGKRVRVSLIIGRRSLAGYIRDPGKGFSFGNLEHAAVSNPSESPTRHAEIRAQGGWRPGGFGILISRSLVDELIYNQKGNAAMFVKYL